MILSALLPLLLASGASADSTLSAHSNSIKPASSTLPELAPEGEDGWSGQVTAGATLSTGNTETKSASLSADAIRRDGPNRLTLGAFWNYQEDSTRVIQRKTYGKAQFDHFYNEATYSYANASGDIDKNAALDLRWTGGVGLGHQFRDDKEWNISGELGLSYVSEDFKAIPPAPSATNEYLAARAAYNFDYLAGENWAFGHSGEIFPSLEDGDDIYARFDTHAKTNLTETMFAQIQWIWDYDNTPAAGKGRHDSLFLLTLGWTF